MTVTPTPHVKTGVGVIVIGFEGAAQRAFDYLITHLNLRQTVIDFQLVPLCPSTKLGQLLAEPVTHKHIGSELVAFRKQQADYLKRLDAGYSLHRSVPQKFVVVSLAAWTDNYYSMQDDEVAVIALGHWRRQMAPPSAVEIALCMTLVTALRLVCPSAPGSHLGTKGCLFDFNSRVSDVRLKVFNGHICGDCNEALEAGGHNTLAADLAPLLEGRWLGALTDGMSPAAICRKLGYDLFRTKGFAPTFLENVLATLKTDSAKVLVQGLIALALAALGLSSIFGK